MPRRRVLAIAGVAAFGGSLLGHVAGAFSRPEAQEVGEMAHGSGWLPAILATTVVVLFVLALPRRISRLVLTLWLAATPVLALALQEVLERLLSTGPSPFATGHEPGMLGSAGALLPWILATFLLARAVAVVARVVGARTASGLVLVPPAVGPQRPRIVASPDTGRYDSILDRPPRAPPGP